MATRTPVRAVLERLEPRDTPSAGAEDVLSLPHLAGMGGSYPVETDAQTVVTATSVGRTGGTLKAQPRPRYAVAAAAGHRTTVQVYDGPTNALVGILTPYDPAFTGGARVAVGDVTGDGVPDVVTAPASNHAPEVHVYDGATLGLVRSFYAYAAGFTAGVFVAAGDVDGDGRADVVTGAGAGGGPHVNVFDARQVTGGKGDTLPAARSFYAYEPEFRGGVSVAVGDVDADGRADVVTGAGPGGGPRVRVLSGTDGHALADYFAFDPASRAGVAVAAADFGKGRAEVAVTPLAGGVQVRVYDGTSLARELAPLGAAGRPGSVAARDLDGDGVAELVTGSGPGARPRVVVLDARTSRPKRDLPALTPEYTDGVLVG